MFQDRFMHRETIICLGFWGKKGTNSFKIVKKSILVMHNAGIELP